MPLLGCSLQRAAACQMSAVPWGPELQPGVLCPHEIKDITNGKKPCEQPKPEATLHPSSREKPLLLEQKSYLHLCAEIFILGARDTTRRTWTQWCRYREPISVSSHCFLLCGSLTEGVLYLLPALLCLAAHCCLLAPSIAAVSFSLGITY